MDKSSGIHYQLIAITIGLILFAGSISGSAPIVFADQDEDRKEKLKKLIAKIRAHLHDDKCAEKQKYFGKCDIVKPKVDITSPQKRAQVESPVTITGTASDVGSGLKEVLVRVGFGGYVPATINNGDWELTVNLNDGRHLVFAKAIDNVGNVKRDFTFFTIV